jgi:leucyl-tRNA synthetase
MEKFVIVLSLFAPHIGEELWRILGFSDSVTKQSYPEYDESKIVLNQIEFVFQVNSKIRSKIMLNSGMSQEEIEKIALKDNNVLKHINNQAIKKVVFVKNKLINFIVG